MPLTELLQALENGLPAPSYSVDGAARRIASTDYYWMSPILSARIDPKVALADVVLKPTSLEELRQMVSLCCRCEVPLTPRGKGTGNYGQAVPLAAGAVLDTSALNRVHEVGDGWIDAECGATFVDLEAAANAAGQEMSLYPSTDKSCLGGFLGGGAGGAGSVKNGFKWNNFVQALTIVPCTEIAEPFQVAGEALNYHLHAFGTTGIFVRAKVRLEPKQDWTAVFISFPGTEWRATASCALEICRMPVAPRLCSLDQATTLELFPEHRWMPKGRTNLRVASDTRMLDTVSEIVQRHGGRVEGIDADEIPTLHNHSYNHVTLHAKKARPDFCHLQVTGDALFERADEVAEVLPETTLHSEARKVGQILSLGGVLLSRFVDEPTLRAGMASLGEIGVNVIDVHTYEVGAAHLPHVEDVVRIKQCTDPKGLLNPGKVPAHLLTSTA